jgi:signal transduction histidine kinase
VNKSKIYLKIIAFLLGIALIILGFNLDNSRNISHEKAKDIIETHLKNQSQEAYNIIADTTTLKSILKSNLNFEEKINQFKDKPFSIIIYDDFSPKFWSSNKVIPQNIKRIFREDFNFVKLDNGYYIALKNTFSENYTAIALIPVYYTYTIQNKYLEKGFSFNYDLCQYQITENQAGIQIDLPDDENVFFIEKSFNAESAFELNKFNFILILIGLVICFFFSLNLAYQLLSFNILLGLLIAFFLSLISFFVFTNIHINTPLFDVALYSSPYFGKSLAGSLFAFLTLLWWVLLLFPFLTNLIKLSNRPFGYIISIFLLCIHTLLLILAILILEGMIIHSTISFNFFNFFSLDTYSFVAIFIYSLVLLSLYLLSKIIFSWIRNFSWVFILLSHAIILVLGISYISDWGAWEPNTVIVIYLFYIIYFIFQEKFNSVRLKSSKYLVIISILALLSSHIILTNIELRDISLKKKTATKLLFDRNYVEEFKFIEIGNGINNDNFIKSNFLNPFMTTVSLEERVKKSHFTSFSQRYDIEIYAFNSQKNTLSGPIKKPFEELENKFIENPAETTSPYFKYLDDKKNKHTYLGKFEIQTDNHNIGYIFIELVPKIYSSSSIYPELLIDGSYAENPFTQLTYAIYKNDKLISSNGDYEYTEKLFFDSGVENQYIYYKEKNYVHLLYRGSEDAVVIISENTPSGIQNVSIFSYTFCFFLLIAAFSFWIKNSFFASTDENDENDEKINNTLQQNIQISIVSLTLLFLIVVGVVTIIYFEKQYDTYHNQRLLRKVTTLMKSIDLVITENEKSNVDSFNNFISNNLVKLAETHTLDINLYDRDGKLSFSTQPEIFNKEILSKFISPTAYVDIVIKEKQRSVISEHIDKLSYLSAYIPYGEYQDKALAYFHFPYYSKEQNIRSDISYFIVALMNVYVILILFAAFVATIVARSITTPLSVIQENIKNLKLGKKNITIEWHKNDEIGVLIKEYNRMVEELEKSAALLARSERESAWREMAKQVAHEIKNPLTPMKLSIQHLQRAIKEKRDNVDELTIKVTEKLIEQIDNLSHIATEFSSFAKMPQAQNEKIELTKILRSTANLFQDYPHVDITMNIPDEECFIFADRNQIMRVFNNIFTNAVQAIPIEEKGLISVELKQKEEVFLIEIKDNGKGIPDEMKNKVFEPNFTTKSSGTGLGLAISRNIIEKAHGRIWFESEEGKGTTFYVLLPKSN